MSSARRLLLAVAFFAIVHLDFTDASSCCANAQDEISELLDRKSRLWSDYESIKEVSRHLKHRLRDLISFQEQQWRQIQKERVELEQNGLEGPPGEQGEEGLEGDRGQPGVQGRPGKCPKAKTCPSLASANFGTISQAQIDLLVGGTGSTAGDGTPTLVPSNNPTSGEVTVFCTCSSTDFSSCMLTLISGTFSGTTDIKFNAPFSAGTTLSQRVKCGSSDGVWRVKGKRFEKIGCYGINGPISN